MRFALRHCFLTVLVACPGPEPEAPEPVVAGSERTEGQEEIRPEPTPRALGPTATFADLVAAARRLDDRGEGDSAAGCILRGTGELGAAWRLEADLAVGVRPLPNPTALVSRLGAGPIRVLGRWGQRGSGDTSFAVITMLPPPERGAATLVALTDEGTFIRTTDGEVASADAGPHRASDVAEHLANVIAHAPADVYVTAEPGVSLVRVRWLLEAMPASARGNVGLAVVLAEGVALPDAPSVASGDGLCTEGMSASTEPEGSLDAAQILASLGPLREAAILCMRHASPEAARGGRVRVALRIVSGGGVGAACASEDELGDARLRACLLQAVRGLRFPDPGGVVEVVIPLVLEPDRSERQRALCD